jgi:CheY-like chemotaxis protein
MKVLIIDNEKDVRRVAHLTLERVGKFQVAEAASGREGVLLAEQEQPDAIILDVMMPEDDGPATLAMLRARPTTAHIPVVFMTAKVMAAEMERLKALGAAGVLVKPFNPATLCTQLQEILGNAAR